MKTNEIDKKKSISLHPTLDGKSMRYEYSKFFNTMPWTHFGTFTTQEPLSLNTYRKLADKIASKIPCPKQQNAFKLFWVAEQFKPGDGYHLHILINCLDRTHIHHLKAWYEGSYGYCKILPVNGRAASYMTKHLGHHLTDYGII